MKRLYFSFSFLFLLKVAYCLEADSVLVINSPQDVYHLNLNASLLKDTRGTLTLNDVLQRDSLFQPLHDEIYNLVQDQNLEVPAYWVKASIELHTDLPAHYLFYFYPKIDTVITFIEMPDGTWSKSMISSLQATARRPVFISQELVFPVVLHPGTTHLYMRISNTTQFSRQMGSIMINLAEEKGFLNYFLHARYYQGIALGMLTVMLVFHVFIYLFFRDKTYLIFVINIFITVIYLLLRKQYMAEIAWLEPMFPLLRYLHDPAAVLLCFTVVMFSQSFLDTAKEDPFMHGVMNFILVLLVPVFLCMVSLQLLNAMNLLSIYLGMLSATVVIIASLRSYWRGNKKSLYVFWGFLIFFFVPLSYLIPLPGYLDYQHNESDYSYFGEALRSLIFAVGIADRFYGIKKEAAKAQIEKQKMFYEHEKRISEDRERIARELHDNIGSQLTLIALRMNRLLGENGVDSEQRKVYDQTNIVISQLRDTIWTMDRKVITLGELANRIRSQLWQLRLEAVKTEVTMQEDLTETRVPHFTAINIYRIVQESIQNSLKHSRCTSLIIAFRGASTSQIEMSIQDNGNGFHPAEVTGEEQYGIRNMKKRAEDMRAELKIVSGNGAGTLISLHVSLADPLSETNSQSRSLA